MLSGSSSNYLILLQGVSQHRFLVNLQLLRVFTTLVVHKGLTRFMETSKFQLPQVLLHREAQQMTGVPSSGVLQPGGSISSGRFSPSNIPVALSQISQGSAHGHTGMTSRGGISIVGNHAFISNMSGVGGSISGISSASATAAGNSSTVPGLGISPILGNVGPQLASSLGKIVVGGANTARSINSVGDLASRVNLAVNSGSGSLNVQGPNGFMGGMLQQVPQMHGVLGNSNTASGGSLSQNQVRGVNNSPSSMGTLNDVNSNDESPFDLNDFPQLTTQRSSMGGAQGQMGLARKQGVGVSSIVQQSQEFSIQNEDFPALPGCKGGSSNFSTDMHQKEHFHENVPMMPSQHFPMARSAGFILGGIYPSNHQQQQQHAATVSSSGVTFSTGSNSDLFQLHGSNLFPSYGTYHSEIQNSGPSSIGMRPLSSPNQVFNLGAYEQFVPQYQHQHNLSQFRLQEMSAAAQPYREQSLKSSQEAQSVPDRFGLLSLFGVTRMGVPELSPLALGIDLTTLGLNLSSSDNLYKAFCSPWSDEPAKGEPQYSIPSCYHAHPPSPLQNGHFSKFDLGTLFYFSTACLRMKLSFMLPQNYIHGDGFITRNINYGLRSCQNLL